MLQRISQKLTLIKRGNMILFASAFLLLYALLSNLSFLLDVCISLVFFAVLYVIDKKRNLPQNAFLFLLAAILLNPLGVFGLYSFYVAFGVLGYDKFVHFFSSFAVTYGLLSLNTKKTALRYALIVLILLGMGVIVELSEFVGSRYFGIERGGILAIGDTLPTIKSDLQEYDVYFDMIFNLLGSLTAVGVILFRQHLCSKKGTTA